MGHALKTQKAETCPSKLKNLLSVEEDLSDLQELRALIKKIEAMVWKGSEKEVDDDQPRSESPQTAE